MSNHKANHLLDIVFRTNMLLDKGRIATFVDVYEAIGTGTIVEWLAAQGADMSILQSDLMSDIKDEVLAALRQAAAVGRGSERSKLGVTSNGLCLLVGLALNAHAIDEQTPNASSSRRN